jgi:transcriptional regulator NrdR family protein
MDNLREHAHAFLRLALSFHLEAGKGESTAAAQLLKSKAVSSKDYLKFLKQHDRPAGAIVDDLIKKEKSKDAFDVLKTLAELDQAVRQNNVKAAAANHSALLHQLDAFTTMLQKADGDPADILQMVRWQEELYRGRPRLEALACSHQVVKESQQFILAYGKRRDHAESYARLLRELSRCFHETAERMKQGHEDLEKAAEEIERSLQSPPAKLENAHRGFLLKLAALGQ